MSNIGTKEIELTQGAVAIVDADIYELVRHKKWCAHYIPALKSYYAVRAIHFGDVHYKLALHRFIMDLDRGDKRVVDHINHDTLDNRRCNLRIVSTRENLQNLKRRKLNLTSSKYVGVHLYRNGVWSSQVRVNDKIIRLGHYFSEKEASDIYQKVCEEIKQTGALDLKNYIFGKIKKCHSSKYTCVTWNKQFRRWKVVVTRNKIKKLVGYFTDEESAYQAYKKYIASIGG